MAWHIAAFMRTKKLPNLKDLTLKNTTKKRQSWRQQWEVMAEWADARKKAKEQLEKLNGR